MIKKFSGEIVRSWGVKLLNECTVDVIADPYGQRTI